MQTVMVRVTQPRRHAPGPQVHLVPSLWPASSRQVQSPPERRLCRWETNSNIESCRCLLSMVTPTTGAPPGAHARAPNVVVSAPTLHLPPWRAGVVRVGVVATGVGVVAVPVLVVVSVVVVAAGAEAVVELVELERVGVGVGSSSGLLSPVAGAVSAPSPPS